MTKTISHLKTLPLALAIILLGGAVTACNSKAETDIDEETLQAAVTYSTTAVKSFSLSEDLEVMDRLEAVFFSIDLDNAVIFNADSLPLGSDITKLVPKIEFQTTMSKAMLYMEGGSVRTDSVNFLETTTDSIDFSGKVTLRVTSYDGACTRDYDIKVNVHTVRPDTLSWDCAAVANLPSRIPSPREQKTVMFQGVPTALIVEADGSATLSTASDIYAGAWTKTELPLPFAPRVRSLTEAAGQLWVLAANGQLFSSADGLQWADTGQVWTAIIGPYLNSVTGIRDNGSGLEHAHWPLNPDIASGPLEEGFPVSGFSATTTLTSKWTPMPTLIFSGGTMADGTPTCQTWAFDGSVWAPIADNPLPAVTGAVVVQYPSYRSDGTLLGKIDLPSHLAMGGTLANGEPNRAVYVSFDNGVNWMLGNELLQLPPFFPSLTDADGIVVEKKLTSDLTQLWKPKGTTASSTRSLTVNGYEASWMCPYIYMCGGILPEGKLSDAIWRGVILRQECVPEF